MTEQAVDVLIVGAGPSRAVAAHTLASRGFSVLCLEQGDRVDSTTLPGNKPEFELLNRTTWSWDGNKRGRREDYPLNMDESDTPAMMFAAVSVAPASSTARTGSGCCPQTSGSVP